MTVRHKYAVRCKGAWFAGPRAGWIRDKRARKLYGNRDSALMAARRNLRATDGIPYPEVEVVRLERFDLVLWIE